MIPNFYDPEFFFFTEPFVEVIKEILDILFVL